MAKKSLIGNMISEDNIKRINSDSVKAVEKTEVKSKRINGLVKPSTYEKAKVKAEKIGISFNEVLNQLLENFEIYADYWATV